MKPIRLSAHAQEQAQHRGATAAEIVEAIREGQWSTAAFERLQAEKQFPFNEEWNRNHYDFKKVRPIFVEEPNEIVVVTVYVYYFNGAAE